jgi:hypothetical protein
MYNELCGPVVGYIAVDDSDGYIYPGTEEQRIASLCERAVDAYRNGEKSIKA